MEEVLETDFQFKDIESLEQLDNSQLAQYLIKHATPEEILQCLRNQNEISSTSEGRRALAELERELKKEYTLPAEEEDEDDEDELVVLPKKKSPPKSQADWKKYVRCYEDLMVNIKKKGLSPKKLRSEIKDTLGVDVKETEIKEYVKYILKNKLIGEDCDEEDDGAVGAGAGGERLYQEDVDVMKATRESKLMSDYKKAKEKFEKYKSQYLSKKDKKSLEKMRQYKKAMDEYGEQLLLEEGIDPSTVMFGKRKTSHLKKHQQRASEVMTMWSQRKKTNPNYTLKQAWRDYKKTPNNRKSLKKKKVKRRRSGGGSKSGGRRNLKRSRSYDNSLRML